MKVNIEVEITNIVVDEEYYSFDYKIASNGKSIEGDYSNDYQNGDTPKQWKKFLENGYAVKLALEQYSEQED